MSTTYSDVIIVGGGPAGLSTALHLLQRNPGWRNRLLLLEKEHYPREKLCAGAITRYGDALLADLKLKIGVPVVAVREMRLQFDDMVLAVGHDPVLRVIRRAEFDAWLCGRARERGARIRAGVRVTGIETDKDGVIVQTTTGRYHAKVLVGADGSKGIVRSQVDLARRGRVSRLLEVVTQEDAAVTPEFTEQYAVFDFSQLRSQLQGYYWDFPSLIAGEPHMNRGLFDSRIVSDRPRAPLKQLLAQSLARRRRSLEQVELHGHPILWFDWHGPFSRPNVLLVGDAAGADPLLGEGIAMALAYGKIAAGAIEDAFRTGVFSFRDYRRRILADRLGRTLILRRIAAAVLYRNLGRRAWHWLIAACPVGIRLLAPEMKDYYVRHQRNGRSPSSR